MTRWAGVVVRDGCIVSIAASTRSVNARMGHLTVDFLWANRRLIVETDGYRYHRGRVAFEDDRARDLELRALGYEVLRLSHHQVFDEPNRIVAVLRPRLAAQARNRPKA